MPSYSNFFFTFSLKQIKSEKLVKDIGFKTIVAINDVLEILRIWREGGTTFEARC